MKEGIFFHTNKQMSIGKSQGACFSKIHMLETADY
jgi:hypothetical protein